MCHFVQVSENYGSKVTRICINVSVDHKTIVPIGEPEKPFSTNVRVRGGALIPGDQTVGALDHDFRICSLVPSATLKRDAPHNANDSFYKGTVLFWQTLGTTCKELYK